MAKTRRYHPLVADDLAAAVAYYDGISVDLGNRFRASVRDRSDRHHSRRRQTDTREGSEPNSCPTLKRRADGLSRCLAKGVFSGFPRGVVFLYLS